MYIFEIISPGIFIEHSDRKLAFRIECQLSSLMGHFFEANTALNLFTSAKEVSEPELTRETHELDRQRRFEIKKIIEQEHQWSDTFDDHDKISMEADIRFKREKWASGTLPSELEFPKIFIYAKAFIYALDSFDKCLGVLAKEEGVPNKLAAKHTELTEKFPDLRGVRNTAQHLEDRSRRLGVGKKRLVIPPEEGGMLMLSCLKGSKFGSTKSDGYYGEVDVSPESMQHLKEILEEVLHSFEWSGPKRHNPSL